MVDVKTITHEVTLITETGARYDLGGVKLSVEREESINELAQRATVRIANRRLGSTWLVNVAKINCIIRIRESWNGGEITYDGTIWDWHYSSAIQQELTITVYDPLIRLQQSREFYYYRAGMTTQALVTDICGQWNIPVSYQWPHSITHGKKAFRGKKSIADMIVNLLEEVKEKTGEKYIIRFANGQMEIIGYGTNSPVYLLDRNGTISTSDRLNINNLVTKVKIYGRQDNNDRRPVEAIVEGDLQFGILQEVILRDSNTTIADARAEADALLEARGKPERTIKWEGADVPFLRKGDRVEIRAGNLTRFFHVEGVVHRGETRRMSLTLSRI